MSERLRRCARKRKRSQLIPNKMYKKAVARQKRNKRLYKKLAVSFRKIVRKIKKIVAFRKWTFKKFEKVSLKLASFMLLITISAGVLNIPTTNAFYNDIESSTGNSLVAGALDFVLTNSSFSPI